MKSFILDVRELNPKAATLLNAFYYEYILAGVSLWESPCWPSPQTFQSTESRYFSHAFLHSSCWPALLSIEPSFFGSKKNATH